MGRACPGAIAEEPSQINDVSTAAAPGEAVPEIPFAVHAEGLAIIAAMNWTWSCEARTADAKRVKPTDGLQHLCNLNPVLPVTPAILTYPVHQSPIIGS